MEYLTSFTSEWSKFSNERGLEKKIGPKKRGTANERLNNVFPNTYALDVFNGVNKRKTNAICLKEKSS